MLFFSPERVRQGYSLKLVLKERVSEVDFVFVSWAVPEYDLEKDKRLRKAEAQHRAEEEKQRQEAMQRNKNSPGPLPWSSPGGVGSGIGRRSWGF